MEEVEGEPEPRSAALVPSYASGGDE
jgi:hypothetical protein